MHSGKTPTKTLLLIATGFAALTLANFASAASLDVHISNLRPTKTVWISVFNDARGWALQDQPVATRAVAARGSSQTVRIEGLAPGRYAVRVRQEPHDVTFAGPISFSFARSGASGNPNRYGARDFERVALDIGPAGARTFVHLWISSPY